MARRFVRDWFTNEMREVNDDSPGGRQIIARDAVAAEQRFGSAYSTTFATQTLAVPIEQMEAFNELNRRAGSGAFYRPMKDGQPYAEFCADSGAAYRSGVKARGKVDFDSYG